MYDFKKCIEWPLERYLDDVIGDVLIDFEEKENIAVEAIADSGLRSSLAFIRGCEERDKQLQFIRRAEIYLDKLRSDLSLTESES